MECSLWPCHSLSLFNLPPLFFPNTPCSYYNIPALDGDLMGRGADFFFPPVFSLNIICSVSETQPNPPWYVLRFPPSPLLSDFHRLAVYDRPNAYVFSVLRADK